MLKYFGEDTNKPQAPEEFFKPLATFVNNWKNVQADNLKMKEAAEKERKKQEEAKRKQQLAEAKKAGNKVDALQDVSTMKKQPGLKKKTTKKIVRVAEV